MNDRAGERASASTSGASARAPERSGGSPGLLSESQIARAPGLSRDAFNAKMDNQLSIAERQGKSIKNDVVDLGVDPITGEQLGEQRVPQVINVEARKSASP
jgi:hypothetical protein